MILVDSGVIVDYLRTGDAKLDHLFRTRPVAVCGVVRAELLHGVRSARDRQRTLTVLAAFQHLPTPEAVWDSVGDNLYELRTNGVTIPFQDAVIATLAIANDIELWSRDGHFSHVQRVLPALRLFVEPP